MSRVKKAIDDKACNALLLKVNQPLVVSSTSENLDCPCLSGSEKTIIINQALGIA